MNKDIIYEFRNIVEESRTEDRQDYYIKLRNALDLLEKLEEENIRLNANLVYRKLQLTECIPISVIQNKIECFKYEEEMLEKGIGSWTHDEIIELYAKLNILQEILEKGNR